MQIEKMYFSKLVEKKPDLDLSTKKLNRISELEEKFKNINFFERNVFVQKSKYYLQNKRKKGTDDIQDTLRKQIDNLNEVYEDNMYFLDIGKEILDKENNKHIYNIYTVSIIEYKKINLYYDLILEGYDNLYSEHLCPISASNLTDELKLYLYELIDDTLNYSEIYAEYHTIEDTDFKNYNNYIIFLKNMILDFLIDIYNNSDVEKLKSLLNELEPELQYSNNIPIYDTLCKYNTDINLNLISLVLDIIIKLNWNIDMGILNVETLLRMKE